MKSYDKETWTKMLEDAGLSHDLIHGKVGVLVNGHRYPRWQSIPLLKNDRVPVTMFAAELDLAIAAHAKEQRQLSL